MEYKGSLLETLQYFSRARGVNDQTEKEKVMAAKAMTKAQIVGKLADDTGLSKKEIVGVLQAQADLSYKQAKSGFTIPGIGKLVIVNRKARKGGNPATGEEIDIPAKRVLKFRIAKAAKDAVAPKK